ncbi:TetR/AcrR family transcriptional regulator [Ralstonia syzygii subsp. celebesensis]|uniref:TetR/AcrR family transcriptional regulator n=3 Tax=Ralstonia solanacearum species complex TaxID=3116862 RepID=A0AAD0SAQ7_RALSL|nr:MULTISPECIES: TetR/AcrR family transcriptional regulator [Ralstonia solanacearum species complex]CCA83438.1 putative transcription regulator protein, TetR family [blood disease bacterium R229]AQW32449.1 TetR family transcriptional regulator [blood disease bacterium A2-HR MARDI]AXV83849.1 TetR/AcrR family transcriptional regulator [Ralstonia solanacearum]AXW54983.1 TetR/AcrR family transcriptional regulator [Ralstonia solanacearum]QQV57970.1 TetR/AcrR family transcriptional regulator [Ralsto
MRKKTEEKRQSIIDAAFHVFREMGFDQASMSDIAARSGASKATLYNYFSSKEEMFAEIMSGTAADEIREAFAQLKSSGPVADTLAAFGEHYVNAILQPSTLSIRRLAICEGDRSSLGRAFYEHGPKLGWAMLAEFLGEAMAAGALKRRNTEIAAAHLHALYEAEFVEMCLLGVPVDISPNRVAEGVARAVDVFMAAYGTSQAEVQAR